MTIVGWTMTDKNIGASRYFQKLGFTVSLLDEELTLPLHRFSEVKQAIQQELLKARIETLEWLLEQEVEFGGLELKQSIIDKVADLQKELFKDLQAKLKENSDG